MLTIYPADSNSPLIWQPGLGVTKAPVWLDLIDPTEPERYQADLLLGVALPTREESSAIELSSRLRSSDRALCLNIPSFVRAEGEQGPSTPLGFVVTPTLLATIRYAESPSFKLVTESMAKTDGPMRSVDIFSALIESIVDVAADRIEAIATDLSKLSQGVFSDDRSHHRQLQGALFKVGLMQRQLTQIRSAILGVSRVVTYLCESKTPWVDTKLHDQFKIVQADIGSLNEYNQQLSDRLQFLLDAVLGFINNQQNDIMRVLTIVSVVTVPPMILAGIWGMNFKSIPEYNWPHGYAFALTMISLSMGLPLIWFRLKKWL
jgi:magnesium transporter